MKLKRRTNQRKLNEMFFQQLTLQFCLKFLWLKVVGSNVNNQGETLLSRS